MYDDSDIDAAVDAGTLTPATALALRRFVEGRRADPPARERDRHFRYTAGTADVLPTLGLLVLMIGIVTSVFTGVVLTRMWVAQWLRRTRPAEINL